jgi:hypothetical protein
MIASQVSRQYCCLARSCAELNVEPPRNGGHVSGGDRPGRAVQRSAVECGLSPHERLSPGDVHGPAQRQAAVTGTL